MANVAYAGNAYDGLEGSTPKVSTHLNVASLWIKEVEMLRLKAGTSIMLGTQNTGLAFTGTGNIAFGYGAANVLASGNNNTIIGSGVAPSLTTGSGNILIGTGTAATTDVSTATASNEFHLGGSTVSVMRAIGINTPTLSFFLDWVPNSTSYTTDAAAAVGGVLVGQIYRNGSVVQCRIA
jgi:hypothetical protein